MRVQFSEFLCGRQGSGCGRYLHALIMREVSLIRVRLKNVRRKADAEEGLIHSSKACPIPDHVYREARIVSGVCTVRAQGHVG